MIQQEEIKSCTDCLHYEICSLWTTTDLDKDEAYKYCFGHYKLKCYRKESDTATEILTEFVVFVNDWFEGVENNDFCVEFNKLSQDLFEKYNGGR